MRVTRRDSLGMIEVVRGDASPGAIAAHETPEGYLLIEGRINGCGVYRYEDAAGDSWGELRLPEHVGAPATVDSWDGRVLTDDHPPKWLDATNTRAHQRGAVTRPAFDAAAGFTFARIVVTDAELIAKIRAGKCELSCGYDCLLVQSPGRHDGCDYDYIQTEIRGNHVAIVDRARGGPMCCLLFDAAGSRMERPSMTQTTDTKAPKAGTGNAPPKKRDGMIKIGEADYEVPDDVAAYVAELEAKVAGMGGGEDAKPEEMPMDSREIKRLRGELERERGRLEVLEQREAKRAAEERARALDALRERAEQIAGCKIDGADEAAVLRAAIVAVDKTAKLDGLSVERLHGRFDALESTARQALATSILTIVRSDAGPTNSVDAAADRRAAKIAAARKGA